MKRHLTLTYTVTESIEVDIPDGVCTSQEIDEIVEKAAQPYLSISRGLDEWDVEWEGKEPIAKGEQPLPLPENWMEVCGRRVATNGTIVILEGCPVEFGNNGTWLESSPKLIAQLEPMLRASAIGPHKGHFRNVFEGFKGCAAMATDLAYSSRSEEEQLSISIAQIFDKGKLIALIMPCHPPSSDGPIDSFQFAD
jgi:hypothetical protein